MKNSDFVIHEIDNDLEIDCSYGVVELYDILISSGVCSRFIPDSFKKLYNDEKLKIKQKDRVKKLENINKKYEKG